MASYSTAFSKRLISHIKPLINPNAAANPIPSLIRHFKCPPLRTLHLPRNSLNLHNRIKTLIHSDELDAASALLLSSASSPDPRSRPTAVTADSLLEALLCRPADAISLHRSIIAANPSFPSTVTTHKTVLKSYLVSGNPDDAMDHYECFVKHVDPFNRSLETFRLLIDGLLDNDRPELAIRIKDDMLPRIFSGPDIYVYGRIMWWFVDHGEPGRGLDLVRELKAGVGPGGFLDKVGYGAVVARLFERGDDASAMEWYHEVFGDDVSIATRFEPESFNLVLEELAKNGRLDEAVGLFRRMMGESWFLQEPEFSEKSFDQLVRQLNACNLAVESIMRRLREARGLFQRMVGELRPLKKAGFDATSFDLVVGALCSAERFGEAVELFNKAVKIKCRSDALIYNKILGTSSCNKLIRLLGENRLVSEAKMVFREMELQEIDRDFLSYLHLVDACFGVAMIDDAISYFNEMVESALNPDASSCTTFILRLVSAGKLDEARGLLDMMMEKNVKPNTTVSCELGRVEDTFKIARKMLLDEGGVGFSKEIKELVEAALRKEGKEEELVKSSEHVKREKAEELALVEKGQKNKEQEEFEEMQHIQKMLEEVKARHTSLKNSYQM